MFSCFLFILFGNKHNWTYISFDPKVIKNLRNTKRIRNTRKSIDEATVQRLLKGMIGDLPQKWKLAKLLIILMKKIIVVTKHTVHGLHQWQDQDGNVV